MDLQNKKQMNKKLLLILIFIAAPIFTVHYKQLVSNNPTPVYNMTIMLDPAGNSGYAGRIIDDWFERGITLQCAEQLKEQLEQNYPGVRIILTRKTAEYIQPLQNANFSNRMNVDLYLSLHFYHEHSPKPNIYIYYFSYNNDLCTKTINLSFYPYEQAYLFNKETTKGWSQTIKDNLSQQEYDPIFNTHGPYSLPFKPLIGIKSPAIGIEASLKKASDWHIYIEPIMASLDPIINKHLIKDEAQ